MASAVLQGFITVLNLMQRMEKNNFNFEKAHISGKGRQSLHNNI